ncbi:MAG: anion permease [Chloroflexota bacterium]
MPKRTHVRSTTATAEEIIPVMISLAMAANVNPIPIAVGCCLGACWGFRSPVSTPPNAIVYGSAMIKITQIIRAVIVFDIVEIIVIWITLRITLPLVGLA